MQNSGDDSILHRLARCFGQGLALGVGLSLTQQALRPKGTRREPAFEPPATMPAAPAVEPPAFKPAAPAPRTASPETPTAAAPVSRTGLDLRAVQAIVSVVEQRIEERAAQTERKLEQIKAAQNIDVQSVVARQVEAKMGEVRTQVAKTQREFAEAVARIVAQQVAQEVAKQTAVIEARTQQRIEAAVAPLRAELRDLRQRLAATENTMRDFANAISDTVRMANESAVFAAPREGERVTTSATSRRPAARAARAPHTVDLRTLRQRLMAADRPDQFPRTAFPA